jgi:hypothetical protein
MLGAVNAALACRRGVIRAVDAKERRHSLINFKLISFNFYVLSALYYRRITRVIPACYRGVIRAVNAEERQALSYKL